MASTLYFQKKGLVGIGTFSPNAKQVAGVSSSLISPPPLYKINLHFANSKRIFFNPLRIIVRMIDEAKLETTAIRCKSKENGGRKYPQIGRLEIVNPKSEQKKK